MRRVRQDFGVSAQGQSRSHERNAHRAVALDNVFDEHADNFKIYQETAQSLILGVLREDIELGRESGTLLGRELGIQALGGGDRDVFPFMMPGLLTFNSFVIMLFFSGIVHHVVYLIAPSTPVNLVNSEIKITCRFSNY